jgi:Raf kinase inhibitor-like YbhB/YbcL family protein
MGTGTTTGDPAAEITRRLTVLSDVFKDGETIPRGHSAYAENTSPPMRWTGAPAETRSFALVVEDPDAHKVVPFIHWVIYNIPGEIGVLDPGLPTSERLNHPTAAMQGKNSKGEIGYFGPRPPEGDPPHRYQFRLFALDEMMNLQPGLTREELFAAIHGHVTAYGEMTGMFQA